MRVTGKSLPEAQDDILGKDRERKEVCPKGLKIFRMPEFEYRIIADYIDFDQEGLEYWAAYGITREQLIHDGVRQVGSFSGRSTISDGSWRMIIPDDICFQLPIVNGRRKIYRPLAAKHAHKWKSDVIYGDMWYLRSGEEATEVADICTSYKDARVVFNAQGGEVDVYGQAGGEPNRAEDIAGFGIMKILKQRHRLIRLKGDFDEAGMASMQAWHHALKFHSIEHQIIAQEPVVVGDKVLKDYADLKKYGYL